MTRIASLVVAASLLVLTTGVARADDPQKDNFDGLGTSVAIFGALELAAPVLLITDLVARPQSRTYGAVEVAVGGSVALLNTWLAIDFALEPNCSDCSDVTPYFIGVAALDLAVVAHGVYLLARDQPAREVTLVPTMVSDGKVVAPGVGLGGTF